MMLMLMLVVQYIRSNGDECGDSIDVMVAFKKFLAIF